MVLVATAPNPPLASTAAVPAIAAVAGSVVWLSSGGADAIGLVVWLSSGGADAIGRGTDATVTANGALIREFLLGTTAGAARTAVLRTIGTTMPRRGKGFIYGRGEKGW